MESIYDYNVTDLELEYLFVKHKNREEYEKFTKNHSRYADLYLLFNLRGNGAKAKLYLNKVVNPDF